MVRGEGGQIRNGAVTERGALRNEKDAGVLDQQPLRPLAHLLTGALGEGCFSIAEAPDPDAVLAAVGAPVTQLLSVFRVAPPGWCLPGGQIWSIWRRSALERCAEGC
jgi:hypothetical protein